jgi:hypothetical protein
MNQRRDLDLILGRAKKQGGVVLSTRDDIVGFRPIIRVACARGHSWSMSPLSLLKGSWCKECQTFERKQASYDTVVAAVTKREGILLTPVSEFESTRTRVRFRCKAGHEWEARASAPKEGYWCRQCFGVRHRLNFAKFFAPFEKRGFQFASSKYEGGHKPYEFICPEGHSFERLVVVIQKGGMTCPECHRSKSKDTSYRRMQAAAEKLGGKMVSREFLGWQKLHVFECKQGHSWPAKPGLILMGHWCLECYWQRRAFGLEALASQAKQLGGRCISPIYLGSKGIHEWECANGHRFAMSFHSVREGSWCAVCKPGRTSKRSIVHMQQLADERGGTCVSRQYIDSSTELEWECAYGHKFHKKPNYVRQGSWCTVCSKATRKKISHVETFEI